MQADEVKAERLIEQPRRRLNPRQQRNILRLILSAVGAFALPILLFEAKIDVPVATQPAPAPFDPAQNSPPPPAPSTYFDLTQSLNANPSLEINREEPKTKRVTVFWGVTEMAGRAFSRVLAYYYREPNAEPKAELEAERKPGIGRSEL